jgi:hypothetical protein
MTLPLDSLTQLNQLSSALSELKQMYQLNTELLEQLSVTLNFLKNSGVHLPNESTFNSLLNKTMTLLDEIQADEPKILTYNISRRKVTDFREYDGTDEEVPVPFLGLWYLCVGTVKVLPFIGCVLG